MKVTPVDALHVGPLSEVIDVLAVCETVVIDTGNELGFVTVIFTFTFVTPLAALAPLFGGHLAGSVPLTGKGVMPCIG